MDAGGNGGKRPFGPHGEGCECEWDEDGDQPGDEEEAMAEALASLTSEDPLSPEERAYERHTELGLRAMASDFCENFLAGLDTCAMDGNTLNRRQVIAMMATMMTGYADACETHKNLEMGLKAYAMEARAIRKRAEAQVQADPPMKLHDVSEIFTIPPQEDEPEEEGPGSPDDN